MSFSNVRDFNPTSQNPYSSQQQLLNLQQKPHINEDIQNLMSDKKDLYMLSTAETFQKQAAST